jgi:hypothetical protein
MEQTQEEGWRRRNNIRGWNTIFLIHEIIVSIGGGIQVCNYSFWFL